LHGPVEVRLNTDEHGPKQRRKKAGAKFNNFGILRRRRRRTNQDMRDAPRCPNPVQFQTILGSFDPGRSFCPRGAAVAFTAHAFSSCSAFSRWSSYTSTATGLPFAHPAQVALDCLHSRRISLRVTRRYLGAYLSCLRRLIDPWQGLSATLPKNLVDQCFIGRPPNV
jgi:hypothetical protein